MSYFRAGGLSYSHPELINALAQDGYFGKTSMSVPSGTYLAQGFTNPRVAFSYPGMNPVFRRFKSRGRFRRGGYKNKYIGKHTYGAPPRGAEAKALDLLDGSILGSGAGNTLSNNVLNVPTVGSSYFNRVGSRIKMKSIDIHFWPAYNGGATHSTGEVTRVILFYDGQPNGVPPTAADLLMDTGGATAASSPVNLNNRDRFLILREWYFTDPGANAGPLTVANVGAQLTSPLPACVHWYIKLKNLETIFKGTGGTVADIASGALFLSVISESTTPALLITGSSRLRFYD